jgi:hypothetical protein
METKISDIDVIKLYRQTKDPQYISEILSRYKNLILKVIHRWNNSNKYCVKLLPSDFKDVLQSSNLAVIYMMNNVNLDKVKVLAVTIKSYIYNMLNVCYRHRYYEDSTEYIHLRSRESTTADFLKDDEDVKKTKRLYLADPHLYLKYHFRYNNYKVGLIISGAKKRLTIEVLGCNALNKAKNKLTPDE